MAVAKSERAIDQRVDRPFPRFGRNTMILSHFRSECGAFAAGDGSNSCPVAVLFVATFAILAPVRAQESKVVKLPGLEIDVEAKEMRISGKFLLDRGVIELLATAPGGKEHESLLVVDCKPSHFQTGLILLGLEKGSGVRFQGEEALPSGSKVDLLVRWTDERAQPVEAAAEDLIWDRKRAAPMPRGGWVFSGSRFMSHPRTGREVFMADLTGVLVVTYHDPDAVLDTTAEGGADDTIYTVRTDAVPKPGTPATLVLRPRPAEGGQGR